MGKGAGFRQRPHIETSTGWDQPVKTLKTEGKAQSKPLFPLQSFVLTRFSPVEAMTTPLGFER